ncbi:MAG: glycosyltransferase family 39 protein [Solirubrobacteraceae bacterium]
MTISLRTGDAAPSDARISANQTRIAPRIAPDVWLVVAITAIATLLRFSTITSQSFWVDEATTVHEVGLSFGAMLHEIRVNETTPPLYFALAWAWTRLFGAGELGIRSLSALAGAALVPVAYLCGRELVSRAAGVFTAALVALSPFMIWYSQEARSYMLLALFSGLSLLYWARAARERGVLAPALWAAFSALAVLTHFFAGFLIAPEALWLVWRRRDRASVIAAGAVAAVQLAVLPLAVADTGHPLDWITQYSLSIRIAQIPVTFGFSQLYQSSSWLPGEVLAAAALVVALAAALVWRGGGERERRGALAAASLAAATILVPVALAELGHDYVVARNLLPAWIPLAVALGAACSAPRAPIAGGVLAVCLLSGFVWAGVEIDGNPAYQRPDWRGVAAALGAAPAQRAIVAYAGNAGGEPLAIYLPRTQFSYSGRPVTPARQTIEELDIVGDTWQTLRSPLPQGFRVISSTAVNDLLVVRLGLSSGERLAPGAIAARARRLLGPVGPGPVAVLFQAAGTSTHSRR